MSGTTDNDNLWETMTHEQKNHQLYLKQKSMLDMFLAHGAISQANTTRVFTT